MSGTSPPFTGVPFGRYLIRRRLARGGMGEVFLADQLGPRGPVRPVALKRMLPRVARDPRASAMFLEEMATAAQLNHPNVATTYDFGEVDGVYFLAMEYVEGLSLRQLVESLGPLPVADALGIAAEIAAALDHAHNRRVPGGGAEPVVHRDVSPHNVMVSAAGAVKLLDFGIARAEAAALGGRVEGKMAYAAPEQLAGSPADRRSDLWALGVVLYEILSGVVPFAAADPVGMLEATRSGHRVPLAARRPEAARVGPIVERAMAHDPDARWPTAEAFGASCRALAAELGASGAEGRAALVARAGGPRVVDSTIGARAAAAGGTATGAGVGADSSGDVVPDTTPPDARGDARVAPEPADLRLAGARLARPPVRTPDGPSAILTQPATIVRGEPITGAPTSAAIARVSVPVGPVTRLGGDDGERRPEHWSGAGEERTVPLTALAQRPPRRAPTPRRPWAAVLLGGSVLGAGALAVALGRAAPPQVASPVAPATAIAVDAPPEVAASPAPAVAVRRDDDGAPPRTVEPTRPPDGTGDPAPAPLVSPTGEPRRPPRRTARPAPTRERRAAEAPVGLGLLSVRTIPWSRVSVDGREIGQSPLVHSPTASGQHTLVLTPGQDDLAPRTLTIQIRAGEVTKVFVDFARDATRIEP